MEEAERRARERAFNMRMIGFFMMIPLSSIPILFSRYNQTDRGFIVLGIVIDALGVAYARRDKLKSVRGNAVGLTLVAVEVGAATLAPMPSRLSGPLLYVVAMANFFFLYFATALFDRRSSSVG